MIDPNDTDVFEKRKEGLHMGFRLIALIVALVVLVVIASVK